MAVSCDMCSGEYCSIHYTAPCDCDVIARHANEDCPHLRDQGETCFGKCSCCHADGAILVATGMCSVCTHDDMD